MKKITIQIQSIIYKNEKKSLLKAIEGINSSIDFLKQKVSVDVQLCYGDASPSPVLLESDIQNIMKSFTNLEFKYKFFDSNSGTASGHNLLGKECVTDYMLIMNPDVIMEPRCIYELVMPFNDKAVGMVEARQTPLELAKEYSVDTLETEWSSTACAIFKTKLYHDLQGFDEKTFFMYCDDLDFSWRIRLNGYKIIYNPSAVIYHAKKLTNAVEWEPTEAEIYYSAEAALLMAYKYSNFERVELLLKQFDKIGGEQERKAANEFRRKKEENQLPAPIDKEHKVAKFLGDNYSLMRFSYN